MEALLKILYITAFPPNHRSGGQTFSLNCISHLAENCTIDLLYFSYLDHECEAKEFVRNVKNFSPSFINSVLFPYAFPLFTKRFSRKVLKYLQKIAPEYDVLYFDFTQVAIYSLFIEHPCKVVRCHDILAQKFSRQNKFFLSWIKNTELKILKSASHVFVPSEKDSQIVRSTYGINAAFTNEYLNEFDFPATIPSKKSFLFFGLWSRNENLLGLIWFIKNVFPHLTSEIKKSLFVMGGGLSKENEEKYLKPAGIKYLGFVKDSYPQIIKSSAMIVPLFEGAGVKVKVLDSFTTGTPVIGTDVAFEGIPEISELTNLVFSRDDFIKKINCFVPVSLEQKKRNAEFFRKIYDKNHLDELLLKVIQLKNINVNFTETEK